MKESYEWVLRAIETSTNDWHLRCCRTLIDLFEQQFGQCNEVMMLFDAHNDKQALLMV